MDSLGDRPAEEITTREINALLTDQAASGVAARTVNKTRQLVCAIYNYACQESTFGLARNPAAVADRRPEPERARLDFYSPRGGRGARPCRRRRRSPRPAAPRE